MAPLLSTIRLYYKTRDLSIANLKFLRKILESVIAAAKADESAGIQFLLRRIRNAASMPEAADGESGILPYSRDI